jgi:hypothetical protein
VDRRCLALAAGRIVCAMTDRPAAAAGFTVDPARLHEARAHHDVAAQALEEVARSLAGVAVPTGRPDSAHGCAELLRELSRSLAAAADGARTAGAAVSAAGTVYSVADTAAEL